MKGRSIIDALGSCDPGNEAPGPRIVLDRHDRPQNLQFALALNNPAHGVMSVDVTPGARRTYELAGDILGALGKRVDIAGAAETSHEAWFRACAWVVGEQIDDIVVCRAHLLTGERWQRLIEIAAIADARVWLLVHRPSLTRSQRESARDWCMGKIEFADFRRRWRHHGQPNAAATAPRRIDPAIPDDEFPTFLSTSRDLLDADTFEWLSPIYWATHEQAHAWFGQRQTDPSDDTAKHAIAEFLYGLLACCRGLSEMVIRARAAQAAAFRHGWLIKINQQALASAYFAAPLSDLDADACNALRLYGHPRYACAAAISLACGEPSSSLVTLDVKDLHEDGAAVTLEARTVTIPEPARGIVRAHLAFRLGEGAADQDPLFVSEKRKPGAREGRVFGRMTAHGLHQRLTTVAIETGLSVIAPEPSGRTDPKRWLRRQGVTVHRLTTAPQQ